MHNFISSLFSLLTDENLMKPENLIFDAWQKPAASYTTIPMNVFKEINSGTSYKDLFAIWRTQKIPVLWLMGLLGNP